MLYAGCRYLAHEKILHAKNNEIQNPNLKILILQARLNEAQLKHFRAKMIVAELSKSLNHVSALNDKLSDYGGLLKRRVSALKFRLVELNEMEQKVISRLN